MVAKFVAVLALVALASASNFNSFSYSVADPYTGDFKNQIEARAGDNVQGQYSLLESDGTRRTVDYAAGAGGFNAVVRKDPALIPAAPIVAPISYAASPIAKLGAIPYAAAPIAKLGAIPYAAAPIAKLGAIPYAAAPIASLGAVPYAAASIAKLGALPYAAAPWNALPYAGLY